MIRSIKVLLVFLGFLLCLPMQTFACSMIFPSKEEIIATVPVIAVGTVGATTNEGLTLLVDEYLKGDMHDAQLVIVHRRHRLLAPDCSTEVTDGYPLAEGTRIVAFLRPNTFGGTPLWQFYGYFEDSFVIVNDSDQGDHFTTGYDQLENYRVRAQEDPTKPRMNIHNMGYPEWVALGNVKRDIYTALGYRFGLISDQQLGVAGVLLGTIVVVGIAWAKKRRLRG